MSAARAAWTHFRGNVAGWLDIDREVAASVVRRIREDRPDFVFAALTGIDKTSHAVGHEGALVRAALQIVDETAAQIRADAERDGRWRDMHLWIASDHGHSPVRAHDDLAIAISGLGFRTIAHPWVYRTRPEVAVMVSGNAMAHLYVDVAHRTRPYWPDVAERWQELAESLLARSSVDLAIFPRRDGAVIRTPSARRCVGDSEGPCSQLPIHQRRSPGHWSRASARSRRTRHTMQRSTPTIPTPSHRSRPSQRRPARVISSYRPHETGTFAHGTNPSDTSARTEPCTGIICSFRCS